jgi:hypothetical protein
VADPDTMPSTISAYPSAGTTSVKFGPWHLESNNPNAVTFVRGDIHSKLMARCIELEEKLNAQSD